MEDIFTISIFIPYLYSIISSLKNQFSSIEKKAFLLKHIENMRKIEKSAFLAIAEDIQNLYGRLLHNFIAEGTIW